MFIAGFLAGGLATAIAAVVLSRKLLRRQRRLVAQAQRRAASAERLAELGRMTGGLAHEIKNPLSTIGLNAQLLAEDLAESTLPPEEAQRLTRRIDSLGREVDRLRGILTDFLQFAGRIHLDPEPIDVNELVDELVDFFLPQARDAGVRLRSQYAPRPAMALVDSSLFKQALLNLLINATQALQTQPKPPDGELEKELMIRVELEQGPPRQVAVHVTDTGPGVAEDELARIFEPYYSTTGGGTGLGLPTARRIIEEHQGHIEVHSEVGRGSDFVIRLPSQSK